MKYNYLFFDLDGTLTDSGNGILSSYKSTLDKYGIDYSTLDLTKYIGPPIAEGFYELISPDKAVVDEAVEYFRNDFAPYKMLSENALYDGITDMLKNVTAAGCKVYLATAKPEQNAVKILEYFNIIEYFDGVFGVLLDNTRGTKAEVLSAAIKEAGCSLESAVMIGDRKHDLLAAAELGVAGIGVLYGYGSHEELSNCKYIYLAKTVGDIYTFLADEN